MSYFVNMNNNLKLFWQTAYLKFRLQRDAFFRPLSNFLIKRRITPNQVTVFRLILALIAPVLLGWNYLAVLLLVIINLLLDGVDGSMARISGKSSVKGKVLDLLIDNTGIVLLIFGLIFWHLIDGFWAAIYLVNYLIAIFLNLQVFDFKKDGVIMFKTRHLIFVALAILVIFKLNWFDYVCLFAGIYLLVENLFLAHKLIKNL